MSGMDFFGHQDRARTATTRLVVLFCLAVLAIVVCIYFAASALFLAVDSDEAAFHPALFLGVLVVTLGIVGAAMLWKTTELRSGGSAVAELLGGTPVPLDPRDPHERMLRNLVEEMAIASGVPVPAIYVLDGEQGLNAFAAGWSPSDAAVAVTRGCLEQLDRDELQGVIAHEFSHVFNGDMRLNIRLMGVLFGIVCIATIGRILVRISPRGGGDKKGGAAAFVLFGLALIVIGGLGVFFARLIQAAVSRQREFLADASAVQYTRNPRGIGLALAKIGGLSARLESAHADEASHMMFADGVQRWFGGGFATHPPLQERIERVLPGFQKQLRGTESMVDAAAATPLPPGFAPLVANAAPAAATAPARGIAPAALVASIGQPAAEHVDAAHALLQALPLDLATGLREPARAHGIALALLLERQPARRDQQLRTLPADDVALQHSVRLAFQQMTDLPRDRRWPLLELAIPALRALPPERRAALRTQARALALADGELSPFEFALLRSLERNVRLPAEATPRPSTRPEALAQHADAVVLVLSTLANAGAHGDAASAANAFARGVAPLALPQSSLLPPERCRIVELERAVAALAAVSPLGKRNLVRACAEAAAADGTIDPDEADLLRALAEAWDCPVPLPSEA